MPESRPDLRALDHGCGPANLAAGPALGVTLGVTLGLGLGACAVAPRPLTPAAVSAAVTPRAEEVATAARAIELSGLAPALAPPPATGTEDPDAAALWHALAWAYARGPVAARRRALAARAITGRSGLPGPLRAGAEILDFDDLERQSQVRLTFDLLGLLGLGRAAAAEHLATAEERLALGALEQAVWAARFAVDAARVRVAAARERVAILRQLAAEVDADGGRLQILDRRGWLPPDLAAAALAMAAAARRRAADAEVTLGASLDALSAASGLPPAAPLLARVTPATLDRFDPLADVGPVPAGAALLATQPELRARRLDYAVAEARLRRTAAETWPDLRLGPRLRITPDTTLVGGVLDVSLPWPGSVSGLVDAAIQQRELARELLEDALVRALAAAASRRIALVQAQATLRRFGPDIEAGTRAAWRAARARFAVDAGALPLWTDRLERRTAGCVARLDAQERAILALLAYREVLGPPEARR